MNKTPSLSLRYRLGANLLERGYQVDMTYRGKKHLHLVFVPHAGRLEPFKPWRPAYCSLFLGRRGALRYGPTLGDSAPIPDLLRLHLLSAPSAQGAPEAPPAAAFSLDTF